MWVVAVKHLLLITRNRMCVVKITCVLVVVFVSCTQGNHRRNVGLYVQQTLDVPGTGYNLDTFWGYQSFHQFPDFPCITRVSMIPLFRIKKNVFIPFLMNERNPNQKNINEMWYVARHLTQVQRPWETQIDCTKIISFTFILFPMNETQLQVTLN